MHDLHQHVIVRRLEQVLIAFFLLAALFLVVYIAAPSIYTQTLLLAPSPADHYPFPATLFLLEFRLNSCEARREAVRATFYENHMIPVYKPLDAKLV